MTDRLTPAAPASLTGVLLQGTAWMVAMRWGMSILGLISTTVLARLLTPEDFGLVAIAGAVIGLAQLLTDFGVEGALLRDKHAGREQFDTAWTVRQIQLGAVAGIIMLAAPWAGEFYADPRIATILRLIALSVVIQSLANIGVVNFRREFKFHMDTLFNVLAKFIGMVITLVLAYVLRSYLALVYGMIAYQLVIVMLSYRLHPYRPRWSLRGWTELWGFSQWILVSGVARFIVNRADILALGRLSSPATLGQYSLAAELGLMPSSEIAMPVSRALVPGFAQLIEHPERLRGAFLKAVSALLLVGLPAGLGLAMVADEVVLLVLGDAWLSAIPLLKVFAAFSVFLTLISVVSNLAIVMGHVRFIAGVMWFQAVLLLALLLPVFHRYDVLGVVYLKGVLVTIAAAICLMFVVRKTEVSWGNLVGAASRPVVASLVMVGVLFWLGHQFPATPISTAAALLPFTVKVLTGALVYILAATAVWFAAGRPDGVEKVVWERLIRLLQSSSPPTS